MAGITIDSTDEAPTSNSKVGAIVVAAGQSRRMSGQDKIFSPVLEQPLIYHTIAALRRTPQIDSIVLVLSDIGIEQGHDLIREHAWNNVTLCRGGERRQDSVRNGLAALNDCQWVLVHDGARPIVSSELISRGLNKARESGAAVAGVPMKDTIKLVGDNMQVVETLPRQQLWAVQTPQIFERSLLERAHRSVTWDVTDDASMIEQIGGKVMVFMGDYENIKVTTPEDILVVQAILRKQGD